MELEIISTETIKPSSPTPPHLRTYKIALLDQLLPIFHAQCVIYYRNPTTKRNINGGGIGDSYINQRLPQLKDSLSETLTLFYPLAGKVKNHLSIDCNDDGVPFVVARVRKCEMAEVLSEQSRIDRLLPRQPEPLTGQTNDVQVAIQLNMFDCGGVAIGVHFSHRIIDAATICAFLKCWATIGGGGTPICWPDYSAASLYPPKEPWPDNLSSAYFVERLLLREGKASTRRFVFDAAAISTLKTRAKSTLVPDPTRIEVLSCFIWKHAMAASRVKTGERQPSTLGCQVNLRRVMSPPLPEYTVGNLIWKAIAFCDEVASEEKELHGLVGLLRAALQKIKHDFVPKSTQGVGGYEAICKYADELYETCSSTKNLNPYVFNSWCRIGFHDVDFGWGNPACITAWRVVVDSLIKNYIFFIESGGCDDKIEAWITLDLHQMAILENDPEFLEVAASVPTPAPTST